MERLNPLLFYSIAALKYYCAFSELSFNLQDLSATFNFLSVTLGLLSTTLHILSAFLEKTLIASL